MHNIKELIQLTVKSVKLFSYPVGSIYVSAKATSPAELFGGTWKAIEDVFLYCAGPKHAAGTTGGEETHKLVINEMLSHSHWYNRLPRSYADTDNTHNDQANFAESVRRASNTEYVQTGSTGKNQPHNNMPPYKSVYAWERVK